MSKIFITLILHKITGEGLKKRLYGILPHYRYPLHSGIIEGDPKTGRTFFITTKYTKLRENQEGNLTTGNTGEECI